MGQDARVRYTKMIIQEKFLSLLEQKPLSRVTVKEICTLAEINRTTFYKYYSDAFDLMDKIEAGILTELREAVSHSLDGGLQSTLIRMLEKMQEKSALYTTLFSENGDPSFPVKIFQICNEDFAESIPRQLPGLTGSQQVLVYIYTAQGCSGILTYWIKTGMQEAPEEIAAFISRLIDNTMKTDR